MLTVNEAKQRLQQSEMTLSREGASINWIVTFSEDDFRKAQTEKYVTDDLEDAVFQGQKMRRHRYIKCNGRLCA